MGKLVKQAKYLGNIRYGEGHTKQNVDKRIKAAVEGCYSMKGLWGKQDISIKCKKTFFIGKVYNNIISGMEAEAPRWNEVEKWTKLLWE